MYKILTKFYVEILKSGVKSFSYKNSGFSNFEEF